MNPKKLEHDQRIQEILVFLELKYLDQLEKYISLPSESKKTKKQLKNEQKAEIKEIVKAQNEKKEKPIFPEAFSEMPNPGPRHQDIFRKLKSTFADHFDRLATAETRLNDPSATHCFYVGSSLEHENDFVFEKCLQLTGKSEEFVLRDTHDFRVKMDDLVRIFFCLSDQINPEKKFFSWEERKKYVLERMMGGWYMVDDCEWDAWGRSFMRNLADSSKRKELCFLKDQMNDSIGSTNGFGKLVSKYKYETSHGESFEMDFSMDDFLLAQSLCNLAELVNVDNCHHCRKLHFLCDKILDLSANKFKDLHQHFVEIFVFYVAKYFLTKRELHRLRITGDSTGPVSDDLRKEAAFCKFVVGFCFRNVVHFGHTAQNLGNVGFILAKVGAGKS